MSQLVGTWRLIDYSDWQDGQRIQRDYTGMFIYTGSGQMSVHINRARQPFEGEALLTSFAEEQMPWYIGYYGCYEVNWDEGFIIHHVEGGSISDYLGGALKRPFSLDASNLFIGEKGVWERHLVKVE
jgi:hypothetical protein